MGAALGTAWLRGRRRSARGEGGGLADSGAAPRAPRRPSAPPTALRGVSRRRPSVAGSSEWRARGVEEIQPPAIELQTDARADPHIGEPGDTGHERLSARVEMNQGFAAQRLDHQHVAIADALVHGAQSDELGPDPDLQLALVRRELDGNGETARLDHPPAIARPRSEEPT